MNCFTQVCKEAQLTSSLGSKLSKKRINHRRDHTKRDERSYFDWIEQQLNIKEKSDWYKQSPSTVKHFGVLAKYKSSLYRALQSVYPEFKWEPWKFQQVPLSCWNNMENQRGYIDWIGQQLGIKQMEDWYKFNSLSIVKQFGHRLLGKYNYSLYLMLKAIYPEFNWEAWKFQQVPNSFWEDEINRRSYMDWLGKQLNIKQMEDWYKITPTRIAKQFGLKLLDKYNNSLIQTLQVVYPEFKWEVWKFKVVPKNYWKDRQNIRQFLEARAKHVGNQRGFIETLQYEASNFRLRHYILRRYFKSSSSVFQVAFPERSDEVFKKVISNGQVKLHSAICQIFPKETVHLEYLHSQLVYTHSARNMVLDVFIPTLSLAFEYQGIQHYGNHYLYGSAQSQQQRDEDKRQQCQEIGITLIEIPYWWNGKQDSLIATISRYRPDLL